jgi:hypothetical protein
VGTPHSNSFEILFSRHWIDYYSNSSLEYGASRSSVVRLKNLGCIDRQIDTYRVLFYFFININFNSRATLDKAMEAAARFDFETEVPQQGTA